MDINLAPIPASHTLAAPPAAPDLEAAGFTHAAEREAAFDGEFFWEGRQLHGFSVERYTVFVSQRIAVGAPRLHLALQDGSAFYPDALRILWLCSADSTTISMHRRDPDAMQAEIERWAQLHAPIHHAAEALEVAIGIFNAAHENRHEPRHTAIDSTSAPSGN